TGTCGVFRPSNGLRVGKSRFSPRLELVHLRGRPFSLVPFFWASKRKEPARTRRAEALALAVLPAASSRNRSIAHQWAMPTANQVEQLAVHSNRSNGHAIQSSDRIRQRSEREITQTHRRNHHRVTRLVALHTHRLAQLVD